MVPYLTIISPSLYSLIVVLQAIMKRAQGERSLKKSAVFRSMIFLQRVSFISWNRVSMKADRLNLIRLQADSLLGQMTTLSSRSQFSFLLYKKRSPNASPGFMVYKQTSIPASVSFLTIDTSPLIKTYIESFYLRLQLII